MVQGGGHLLHLNSSIVALASDVGLRYAEVLGRRMVHRLGRLDLDSLIIGARWRRLGLWSAKVE